MARDPELQQLVDAAHRERARQAEPEPPRRERKPRRADAPVTFRIYWRMHPGGIGFIAWLAVLVAPFVAAGGLGWLGMALAGLFVARLLLYFGLLYRGYTKMLAFPAQLAFPVEGWPGLLGVDLTSDVEQWTKTITVTITPRPGADVPVLEAACELFMRDANRRFYGPGGAVGGTSGDPREEWTRTGLTLHGSGNLWVIGAIHRLIEKLDWIERRTPAVEKVALDRDFSVYGVPRPSAD